MRVLQVITKGEVGGAQSHVRTLARYLVLHGIEVQVCIGGRDPGVLGAQLAEMSIPVHSLPALGNAMPPLPLWRAVRELLRLIHSQSPHLLHAHSAMAGVVARIAGRIARVPVVYTVHGFAFKPGSRWPRRTIAWCTEWLLAPWTQQMICVSDHERAWARRLPLPAARVTTIFNGMEDVPFRAAPDATTSIVMVARMAPPKRPDVLLQALALLRAQWPGLVPAHLLGGGPLQEAQQQLAARLKLTSVVFAGDVADVPARLAQQAIFVLMSDHEGLPISIIEAMRAGLAVVASDLPGIRELLPQAEMGLCIPNEAAQLAAALHRLIESPGLRAQLGHAARQRFEQVFTAERMGAAVLARYAALHPLPAPS